MFIFNDQFAAIHFSLKIEIIKANLLLNIPIIDLKLSWNLNILFSKSKYYTQLIKYLYI